MYENTTKNRGYWTKSVKVASYLRLMGNLAETSVSNKVTDKNPRGLIVFYYEDGDRVRDILRDYKDDVDFHDIFDCYYQVRSVIHAKNKQAKAELATESEIITEEGETNDGE